MASSTVRNIPVLPCYMILTKPMIEPKLLTYYITRLESLSKFDITYRYFPITPP